MQACIIHLIRNTFRYASRKYWDQIAHDLRPIYTAANEAEARARLEEYAEKWGKPYPAIKRLWENAWSEFVPFLDYDVEIRKIICSTDVIVKIVLECRGADPGDRPLLAARGFLHRRPSPPERRRGQDAAPHWTNDLDRAEHRHILKAGGTPPHGG